MDFEKFKEIVISCGVLDVDVVVWMLDVEVFNLIFVLGFLIKIEISDIFGCGVGMDVVKIKIN